MYVASEAGPSSEWQDVEAEKCPTLILDGCKIYSTSFPSRVLYELSNPPCDGGHPAYGLDKVTYKTLDGEVKRRRATYIYDLRTEIGSLTGKLSIHGQRSSKFTERNVLMARGVSTSYYKLPGHLKVTPALAEPKCKLSWRSDGGKALATELRGTRDAQNKMVVMPRLEVSGEMSEKELDLLVAAWCARVWQESAKDTKEPMSWGKCEFESAWAYEITC